MKKFALMALCILLPAIGLAAAVFFLETGNVFLDFILTTGGVWDFVLDTGFYPVDKHTFWASFFLGGLWGYVLWFSLRYPSIKKRIILSSAPLVVCLLLIMSWLVALKYKLYFRVRDYVDFCNNADVIPPFFCRDRVSVYSSELNYDYAFIISAVFLAVYIFVLVYFERKNIVKYATKLS